MNAWHDAADQMKKTLAQKTPTVIYHYILPRKSFCVIIRRQRIAK